MHWRLNVAKENYEPPPANILIYPQQRKSQQFNIIFIQHMY